MPSIREGILFFLLLHVCHSCPQSWTSVHDRKCVKLFPVALDHNSARVKCQQEGATLFTVEQKDEWEPLAKMAAKRSFEKLWTTEASAKLTFNENGYCAFFHLPATERLCPVYEIKRGDNPIRRCDGYCSRRYSFGCQKPFTPGPGTQEENDAETTIFKGYSCPSKYTLWDKHCYQFLAGLHGWPVQCSHNSGLLGDLMTESEAEENFIRVTMKQLEYGTDLKVWVDADCSDTACEHSDGSPVTHSRINFASCRNLKDENVYWDLTTDEWNCVKNGDPSKEFYSVCKLPANKVGLHDLEIASSPAITVETTTPSSASWLVASLWNLLLVLI
ncbi:hypothetical protein HDE_06074 [Halotydeus destructor]|nr:hypothetical protein HDE_06074 [Halotydeus destructor]